MNNFEFMNIETSDVLSLLAMLGTVYTYFVHNRKINKQQKTINAFQIKQMEEELEEKKKANLVLSSGAGFIDIINKGNASAKNIKIEIVEEGALVMLMNDNLGNVILECGESVRLNAVYATQLHGRPVFKIIWNDDYSENREKIISLT